jgi:hypothetical protein
MTLSTPADVSTVVLATVLMICDTSFCGLVENLYALHIVSLRLSPYGILEITGRVGSQWPLLLQPYRGVMEVNENNFTMKLMSVAISRMGGFHYVSSLLGGIYR